MDWQQKLFHRALSWARSLGRPSLPEHSDARVLLSEVNSRLTVFARLLSGSAVELLTAEQEGGWTGKFYYLPIAFDLGDSREENLQFYLFRIAYLSCQRQLEIEGEASEGLEQSRIRAYACSERVLLLLFESYPSTEAIYQRFLSCLEAQGTPPEEAWLLWGHLMPPLGSRDGDTVAPGQTLKDWQSEGIETTLEAPAREQVEVLEEDRDAIRKYNLQHYFEKVETIEEFQGPWRETDGSDDLSEHAEALQEVDMRQVVRSHEPVHSVFQSQFMPGNWASESKDVVSEGFNIPYKEWNVKRKAYRSDWCRVYPVHAKEKDPDYVQHTLQTHRVARRALMQRFSHLFNQSAWVTGQNSGDEMDLDRLLHYAIDLKTGRAPCERVYLQRRKQQRDHSILLLMDLSLSSDGYTGGQRILDVEKQAVILLGDVLQEFGEHFQVDGFSSQTRHHCDYQTFKSFNQSWATGAAHIGAADCSGYTRIGPALRHATAELRKQPSRSRWIVLLSDGKPNDYDRYEGAYGLADVRQAIKEARQEGIQTYGLAVESAAKYYLPLMLGHGCYRILPRASMLPEALGDFYTRLKNAV